MKNVHKELVEKTLSLIETYHDDLLVHDKNQIEAYPGRPYLHFTGDTGTLMVTLYEKEDFPGRDEKVPYLFGYADRNHILKGIMEQVKCVLRINRRDCMLYYNGITLKSVEYYRAKEIAEDYTAKMERQFKAV